MGDIVLAGATSGTTTLTPAAVSGTTTLTLPATTDTLVGKTTTDTLTNKTLTNPTFNSAQLATVSGTAPLYMCRAWVNFNGTGTVAIRASGNVTSITDNGTGDYTVNLTTAMTDSNYSPIATPGNGSGGRSYQATTTPINTTSFGLLTVLSASYAYDDAAYISAAIFR